MSFLKNAEIVTKRISELGGAKNGMCMDVGKYNIFDMRSVDVKKVISDNRDKWAEEYPHDIIEKPPFSKFGVHYIYSSGSEEDGINLKMDSLILSEVSSAGEYKSITLVGLETGKVGKILFMYSRESKEGKGKMEHSYLYALSDDMSSVDEFDEDGSGIKVFADMYNESLPSCIEYINAPSHFIVRESSRRKAKGKKNAHHNRPKYRILSKEKIKSMGFLQGEGSSKCPHARRGHNRRIKNKHPEWHDGDATRIVWVKPSWIGPDQMDKGGVHYKVLYNL